MRARGSGAWWIRALQITRDPEGFAAFVAAAFGEPDQTTRRLREDRMSPLNEPTPTDPQDAVECLISQAQAYSPVAWSPDGKQVFFENDAGTIGIYHPADNSSRTLPTPWRGTAFLTIPK